MCLIEMTDCFAARNKSEEEKKKAGEKVFNGGMQDFNKRAAAILKKRGGKYFAGNKVSQTASFHTFFHQFLNR